MKKPLKEIVAGDILIAMPPIQDPHFYRSIILVCDHRPEGSFGLVVNRPIQNLASEIFPCLDADFGNLFCGGPVENSRVVALENQTQIPKAKTSKIEQLESDEHEQENSIETEAVLNDHIQLQQIRLNFDPDKSAEMFNVHKTNAANNPDSHSHKKGSNQSTVCRFFVGYSGWGAGQLEDEVQEGAWAHKSADPSLIFHPDPSQMWKTALRDLGGDYALLAEMPIHPDMN